jgi:hypothetical protein
MSLIRKSIVSVFINTNNRMNKDLLKLEYNNDVLI